MKKIFRLSLLLMLLVPFLSKASIPDSLTVVSDKLNELIRNIEQCDRNIITSDDLALYSSRLEQLRDCRNRLQTLYPLSDYDELWNLAARFDYCDRNITERVADWEKKKQRLLLIDKMNTLSLSFDSLLSLGQDYASRKSADSVRSIKLRADDQWGKVDKLKSSAEDDFEADSLKALYKHVEYVRAMIQDLPEKEPVKPRDILLVAAALVAAVAMILTLIRSISISKKSKETPSVEI